MTIWTPTLDPDRPLYLAIAEAIARAVQAGELVSGQRLPTQRQMAEELGIALTTVTRGYREAERRGLVQGEVGRGTFVSGTITSHAPDHREGPVDLRPNTLIPLPLLPKLLESMAAVMQEATTLDLVDYGPHAGRRRHREAGARWLNEMGVEASPARVVLTSGAQHAMAVALSTLVESGDVVLVEEFTYAGMKSLAGHLGLRLVALPMDGEGILPDALERACVEHRPIALYTMPTIQNPTSAVMSEERRAAVADVLNAAGVALVEDDSYGYLLREPRRLSTLCERAFYIAGTSKSLLPALRVGYLLAPPDVIDRVEAVIAATTYLASPLLAEVATRWISDGTAEGVMTWKRQEVGARQALSGAALAGQEYGAHEVSPHGWLSLPEPWTGRELARRAADQGVLVTPADVFAVARDRVPRAVRICVGAARSREALARGLEALTETLAAGPEPLEVVV